MESILRGVGRFFKFLIVFLIRFLFASPITVFIFIVPLIMYFIFKDIGMH